MGILDGRKKESIQKAVELIQKGEVVAFPTETVYGLGADAFNDEAVKKIFNIKGRPFQDPLILHIADDKQLNVICDDLPPQGMRLIQKFWPGPLTLILKKTKAVSHLITAGMDTVAVRMPRNIIALALIKNSKTVIAAPSANRFQALSPTTAKDVQKELGNKVPLILDGGPSLVGLESTIVSLVGKPKILRLGGISVEDIEDLLDESVEVVSKSGKEIENQVAPGQMEFHYAPSKPLRFLSEDGFFENLNEFNLEKTMVVCFSGLERQRLKDLGVKNISVLSESGDFSEAAKNYYSLMRKIDEGKAQSIICIQVPDESLGKSINERFKKAQHQ